MGERYHELKNGDSVKINWKHKGLVVACCDCLLTHKFTFSVRKDFLHIKIERNNRKTGQLRRWRKKKLKNQK